MASVLESCSSRGSSTPTEEGCEQTEQQVQQFLDRQVERIRNEGVVVSEPYFRGGRPANEIVKYGEELSVGLAVVGSKGLGGI